MTDSTALVELEKRLAEATGPDREIDYALYRSYVLDANHVAAFDSNIAHRKVRLVEARNIYLGVPKYTGSVDFALALVSRCLGESKLAAWDIGFAYNGGPYSARIYLADTDTGTAEIEVTHRHSAALALLLALVRALQSQSKKG